MNMKKLLAGLLMCAAPLVSQATPIVFFGEDTSTGGTALGANSAAARADFLLNLTGVGVQDFESLSGSQPFNIVFPGTNSSLPATLSGNIALDTSGPGRFPTSGTTFLEATTGNFEIAFSQAISAFGFNGIDIGDFVNAQMVLQLTDVNDVVTSFTVNHSLNLPNRANATLFWGIVDNANSFKKIVFTNAGGGDRFAFDDMVVGDVGQINPNPGAVPTPASILLLGAGLLAFRFSRKKS